MVTDTATPPTEEPKGRSIYDQLRWDIVHGILRPNEALTETVLSEQLGVSRTPIRESLQRLAEDGLIVSRRRRWYVYEHSIEEIREIYEIRAALEGFAARLASDRVTAGQLKQIRAAAPQADSGSSEDRVISNDQFHDLINQASGNERIVGLIDKTRVFHFNRRLASAYTDAELKRSTAQHSAIVDSIAEHDGDRAERLVRDHVLDAASIAVRIMGL